MSLLFRVISISGLLRAQKQATPLVGVVVDKLGGKVKNDFCYINNTEKIEITCEKGHIWKMAWMKVQRGHWCPYCANKIVDEKYVKKFIKDKGGRLEKTWKYTTSTTPFKIQCEKGHVWNAIWGSIKQGHWCPECAGNIIHEEDIKEFIKNKGGEINTDWKFINVKTKFKIKCKKGHVFESCWNKIQQGHWCHYCLHKTEQKFREFLEKYFKKEFLKKKPEWLIYPKTNSRLELDGYNEDLKIAFEYQGEQHYIPCLWNNFSEKFLIEGQKKDIFKLKKCKEMGVLLIVVPFWIPKKEWLNLIPSATFNPSNLPIQTSRH
jgi:hypothetical protein